MNERGDEMRKLEIILSIALSSIFFSNVATAQNKPLACQEDKSIGMDWERGSWVTKNFNLKRFILVQARDTLTLESVAKAMFPTSPTGNGTTCESVLALEQKIMCVDRFGTSLYFDPKTLKGGMSRLFGTTATHNDLRDSVHVSAFSCTSF